jgi:PEP-CTERM motif-containing protein
MRFIASATLLLATSVPAHAATVLYSQDFEAPTGFVNDGGDVNIYKSVNQLYGNQPPGFTFGQTNTVETLRVGGTQAWGTGFLDPQQRAGNYVLGLLSDVQNDWLGLAFDVGAHSFLNFRLDISSIDLDRWNGPFVAAGGEAPTFRFSLYDNPTGTTGIGGGTLLSFADVSGKASPLKNTFDWMNVVAGLPTAGNTNGKVILRIDLLSGGYAAMDNFVIASSDKPGEVPTIPEPGAVGLLLGGLGMVGAATARRGRQRSATRR